MDTIYFDWSARRKIPTLLNDGDSVTDYSSLSGMLDSLPGPHRIIGEATFESFNLKARREFIERCKREGHDLLTVPTRATARWRVRAGHPAIKPPGRKGDLMDLQAIRLEAQHVHLKKPSISDDDPFIAKRLGANRELQLMRADVREVIGPRGGVGWTDAKEDYALELIRRLPPFESLPEILMLALGNGGGYNTTIVAAAGMAAKYAASGREFDRLTGMNAHGYGSQIRSDLNFHGWAGPTRRKLNTVHDSPDYGKRLDGLTISQYRWAIRWLYHHLKAGETWAGVNA